MLPGASGAPSAAEDLVVPEVVSAIYDVGAMNAVEVVKAIEAAWGYISCRCHRRHLRPRSVDSAGAAIIMEAIDAVATT